jgi:hypothetical protein
VGAKQQEAIAREHKEETRNQPNNTTQKTPKMFLEQPGTSTTTTATATNNTVNTTANNTTVQLLPPLR